MQTIALFGGTFDPVHRGHVETVAALQKSLNIDQIRWVLSAQPPHKNQPQASIEQRMAMLDLALSDYPNMHSDDVEVRRDQASYTIDTLLHFRELNPQANILLIVGSDIMQSFHLWHRYADILDVANLIVMHRAGYENDVNAALEDYVNGDWSKVRNSAYGNVFVYAAPPIPISATKVRNAITAAQDVSQFLHPHVDNYIQQHQLYQLGDDAKYPEKLIEDKEENMIESHAQAEVAAEPVLLSSEQQVELVVETLEESKALDITVLNISEVASFADYMVVATGTSNTHLQAVSSNAIRELSRQGLKVLGEEGRGSNEWVLADFGDVVVHIMRQEVRELYALEKLWDPEVRKVLAEGQA